MSTAPTIDDIIRIMREQPEARAALRREVLTDELLSLPDLFATLAKRVDDIAERLDTLTRRVDGMAERLDTLTRRVDDMAERLDTLTRRVDDIAERLDTLTKRLDTLTEHIAEMDDNMGKLLGDRLERRAVYKLPPTLSQRLGLRRARAVYPVAVPPSTDLSFPDMVEAAAESGIITEEQELRLKLTDLVFHARRKSDGERVWFAVEASGAIGPRDIERAAESAGALRKVFDESARAVVTGHRIRLHDHRRAEEDGVMVLIEDDPWS